MSDVDLSGLPQQARRLRVELHDHTRMANFGPVTIDWALLRGLRDRAEFTCRVLALAMRALRHVVAEQDSFWVDEAITACAKALAEIEAMGKGEER